MAEDKKAFILYADQITLFEELPDEIAGKLIKHIYRYVNDQDPQTDELILKIAFEPIKQQLKRDLKKYETRAQRSRANGAKGGRPKKPTETQKTQQVKLKPRKPDKDTVTDKDTVKDNVTDIKVRKEEFKNSLPPFLNEYGREMLNDFFEYWTEASPGAKKMRYEKEKAFDVSRRLKTWKRNSKKFDTNGTDKPTTEDKIREYLNR